MKVKEKDLAVARKIKGELKEKLGDKLISVTLFGSRARGTARRDSDLDLFILMKNRPKYYNKENDIIISTTYKYLLEKGVHVSPIIYGLKEYREWHKYLPIFHWIKKEGIRI